MTTLGARRVVLVAQLVARAPRIVLGAPLLTALLLALLFLTIQACAEEPSTAVGVEREAGIRFERAPSAALPGPPARWTSEPFDVVATDMDGDDDPDLLVNWHHHGPLELFENRDGRFHLRNPPESNSSGLDDTPGVASLFVAADTMRERIRALGEPGLYVWHDPNRGGFWRFRWIDPAGRFEGASLVLETSLRVHEVRGVEAADRTASDVRHRRIALRGPEAAFAVRTYPIGVRLDVALEVEPDVALEAPDAASPMVFAGGSLARFAGRVALWKPDPHGIAWVDVEGSERPEIAITRGGLGGRLVPPAAPKSDRYYRADPSGERLYRMAPAGFLANGYGRGRRLEWVDADGDGSLDLSVANAKTPNALFVRDVDGALRDAAPELGLDFMHASVQAWGDLEPDGRAELFLLDGREIRVARRGADGRFSLESGAPMGLVLPPSEPASGLFDPAAIHLADFDADGALDLLVTGYAGRRTVRLFLREGARFEDVTPAWGIGAQSGVVASVIFDADGDGFPDVLCLAKGARTLWRNDAGRALRAQPLRGLRDPRIRAATALDADGDGHTDLVLVGRQRHLMYNRGGEGNGHLDVSLRSAGAAPIGALVRAHYDDGRVAAQRYGSARSSAYSQVLTPLRFGVAAGRRIERVGVIWPGDATERFAEVAPSETRIALERPQ